MELGKQDMRWVVHALLVVAGYTFSFAALKYSSDLVHSTLLACTVAGANFICHSLNVGRLKVTKNIKLDLPLHNILIGVCVGLFISMNNVSLALMFDVDAPLSIAMPVINTGIVILSVIYGLMFLYERLQKHQFIGVLLSVLGIVLINV